MTATAEDEVGATFLAALKQDAAAADHGEPDFPAPPPVKPAPKDGDARPRTRKARAPKPAPDARPRTAAAPEAGKDYTGDLLSLGMNVWGAASMVRGFELGTRKTPGGGTAPLVKVPDMRPYAAVLNQSLPGLATAWNRAAQQDARVRAWVEKFTGGEAPTWVIGVGAAMGQLAAGCYAMAKAPAEVKAQAAEANDQALQEAVEAQVKAMGMAA
jgi:hypothetical protein